MKFPQSALTLAVTTSLVNFGFVLRRTVPVVQSYILESLALLISAFLTYFNHTRARSSSTIILVFWPVYLVALAIWVRTTITKDFEYYRPVLALKCTAAGLGFIAFALECICPEIGQESSKITLENPVITANIFSRCVCSYLFSFTPCFKLGQFFFWLTPLLRKQEYVTENDLPSMRPQDDSENLARMLEAALSKQ